MLQSWWLEAALSCTVVQVGLAGACTTCFGAATMPVGAKVGFVGHSHASAVPDHRMDRAVHVCQRRGQRRCTYQTSQCCHVRPFGRTFQDEPLTVISVRRLLVC